MNRILTGIVVAAAFAACGTQGGAVNEDAGPGQRGDAGVDAGVDAGTNPQATYSYPGCEDAGTAYCPRDLVLTCALSSIATKYDACDTAADCVSAVVPNCIGATSCPPEAVTVGGHAAFLEEATAEARRYCDGGLCAESGMCTETYAQGRVDCVAGHCVALPDVDGGM